MGLPFHPVSKASQTSKTRVKLTQKQMGDISTKVDKQLKERSALVCERCSSARATERAHITGRKHLTHKTTVEDLLHLCTPCHRWLDGDPAGIRYKRKLRGIDL
ncbi:hypothetical protein BK133_00960 [Paenibacillus sp. FSL H8-0548]|uniref:hypothetical protein n=1 Tax=Paenibacillus sp. FSL H8-0548 TaxID=1920422 RepID=UPI00096FA811|nr:hypothetical protein [Paenibacillus sp. FSL H8-0548]OMF38804.1 hypothetical protein BK133_00960 [Paenibacillus sp. FSL H8-0548]